MINAWHLTEALLACAWRGIGPLQGAVGVLGQADGDTGGAPLSEGLALMIVGMAIVFLGLVVLYSVVQLLKLLLNRSEDHAQRKAAIQAAQAQAVAKAQTIVQKQSAKEIKEKKTEPAETPKAPAGVGGASHMDDGALIAILAAAATTLLKRRVRIHRVRFVGPKPAAAWAIQGRTRHMGSHQPHMRRTR